METVLNIIRIVVSILIPAAGIIMFLFTLWKYKEGEAEGMGLAIFCLILSSASLIFILVVIMGVCGTGISALTKSESMLFI